MSSRLSTAGTFNSLSRDHVKLALLALASRLNLDTFNSLSRDHLKALEFGSAEPVQNFQLPLSGSPSPSGGFRSFPMSSLSTPSLGITGIGGFSLGFALALDFQLPLSGSPRRRLGLRVLGLEGLSTPSLWITEPDSGIFRLSAAFCRGTSSHI